MERKFSKKQVEVRLMIVEVLYIIRERKENRRKKERIEH
jgi:hypothetical protein